MPAPTSGRNDAPEAKPTFLFVHGSAATGRSWKPLVDPIEPRIHALTPDRLGCGPGEPWTVGEPTSFDREAQHLAPLLFAQPSPVHLVGHSWGGAVALQMARRWPERIASLTLYEPARFALLFADAANERAAEEIVRIGRTASRWVRAGRALEAAALFVDYWSGAGTWSAMDDRRRARVAAQMGKVGAEFDTAFDDALPIAAWASLPMPVRLLAGGASPAPVRRIVALLRGVLPSASHAVLPGLGHLAPVTHPGAVRDRLQGLPRPAHGADASVPMPMAA